MQATEYLRRGAEAEEKAKLVSDPEVRTQLREIAQAWRDLAEQAQRLSAKDSARK